MKFQTVSETLTVTGSPSLRGRGLKYHTYQENLLPSPVALFARAWIEMVHFFKNGKIFKVALFARAWIEMLDIDRLNELFKGRPLCEGVD